MRRYLLVLDRDLVTADEPRSDPVHRLRLRLGHRLTVFPLGATARQAAPVS